MAQRSQTPLVRMMNKIECGELVYIPSQTTLFRLDDDENVKAYKILSHPVNLLVTRKHSDNLIGVHYQGKTWLLKEKDIPKQGLK